MRYSKITPYWFVLPTVVGLALFRLGPTLAAFVISFTDWNIRTAPRFVGLANYQELFNSAQFWVVVRNTLVFALVYVPGVMVVALILSVLVNQKLRGISFFRGLYFLPYITSMVAVAMVWNWIFSTRFGILNSVLRSVFGVTSPTAWLADSQTALMVLIIVTIWKTCGFQMMIFLAGLQGIPSHLYEAARIDGANNWTLFWRITLPLLTPVIFFVLIASLLEAFATFEVTYAMTGGGPLFASTTLPYYVYVNAFEFNRMGYASAAGYILLIIVGVITAINFAVRRRWVAQDMN